VGGYTMKKQAIEKVEERSQVRYIVSQKRWKVKPTKGYIEPATLTLIWGIDGEGDKRVSIVEGYTWINSDIERYGASRIYSRIFNCADDAKREYDLLKQVIGLATR
jgi:phosphomevalonate kinase